MQRSEVKNPCDTTRLPCGAGLSPTNLSVLHRIENCKGQFEMIRTQVRSLQKNTGPPLHFLRLRSLVLSPNLVCTRVLLDARTNPEAGAARPDRCRPA